LNPNIDIDTYSIKRKSRLRGLFSKILNFICALIIFAVILFSIGAFMQADLQSKNILGNQDYQIFSYDKTADGIVGFNAFGESFSIDLNKLSSIKERFDEISAINKDYTPSLVTLSGDILNRCVSSVSDSFMKIPKIIQYLAGN